MNNDSSMKNALQRLQTWKNLCVGEEKGALPSVLKGILKQPEQTSIQDQNLLLSDVYYLRGCITAHAIRVPAIGEGKNEEQKVRNVFEYVVRNVELLNKRPSDTTFTLHEIALLGKGTKLDRAWLFSEILRQLNIECALLYPKDAGEDLDQHPFVLAVPLEEKTYLFDPEMGLPLTNPQGGLALLSELVSHPEWLDQWNWDGQHPYPFTHADFSEPTVAMFLNVSTSAPRIKPVQDLLGGVIAWDPLLTDKGGRLRRLSKAFSLPLDSKRIRLSNYPERQMRGFENRTAIQKTRMGIYEQAWEIPIREKAILTEETLDEKRTVEIKEKIVVRDSFHYKGRINQLQGNLRDALSNFAWVEIYDSIPAHRIPAERARKDAAYWTAICQLELGTEKDRKAAEGRLLSIIKAKEEDDRYWSAILNLGWLAYLRNDKTKALEYLAQIPETHPQIRGIRFLQKKWGSPTP